MTREKRWTPGPWRVHTPHITSEYGAVANCGDWKDYSREHEQVPNAHLIAAAPELHQSHEWLLDAVHKLAAGTPVRDLDERIEYAKRVDAKAYGETEED